MTLNNMAQRKEGRKNIEQGLIDVLSRELELLFKLREQGLKEQRCLLEDDLEGLKQTLAAQEKMARELAELEKEREALHREVALKAGVPPETSLRELVRIGVGGENLTGLLGKLEQVVTEIKEINETNKFLVSQSLAYVRQMLNVLVPHLRGGPVLLDRSI
ncbi:flagellar protein FlgN [Thermanaeromonas sp.]|uniref:flagellar protein FlgN n=1 Tax=Thermanaeromonas sp. TaxID=2003697 RepID=UPI002618504E|nr:flagellar protein FlgN [Thermanaeromonas sp.]